MLDLDMLIREVVLNNRRKSPKQIADDLDISYSNLMRRVDPNDQYQFPVSLLIPLFRSTRDIRIIAHIAHHCGFVLYRIPRTARLKSSMQITSVISKSFGNILQSLSAYFTNPTNTTRQYTIDALHQGINAQAAAIKTIEKWEVLELPFKEDL